MGVEDVGIHAIQIYYPKNYVRQEDLEKADNASGKYTIGLGQLEMGFCYDNEDVNSVALTVTRSLLETYKIDPNTIGHLSVGTETLVDKSKSVKTQLMELFGDNTDIEGVDVKNACYGGTQALFHAIDWVYANYDTEKRLAMVVMVDIAVYSPGEARCTGGAGAIALLIGPNAPIAVEEGLRATHMCHRTDFYKPIGGVASEYPIVDGSLSLKSYLECVDNCYVKYRAKAERLRHEKRVISDYHSVMFHAPYYKLVQKAFSRLVFTDYENGCTRGLSSSEDLDKLKEFNCENRCGNKIFEKAVLQASQDMIASKLHSNMLLNRRVGNMYTPSLYAQLVTLISRIEDLSSLNNQKILLFSYGSGAASAMFSFTFKITSDTVKSELAVMQEVCKQAISRLDKRSLHSVQQYTEVLQAREKLTQAEGEYTPTASQNGFSQHLFPGAYYLTTIDKHKRRFYDRVPI